MSRPDLDRRPSSTGGTFSTNPAEMYLDARQDYDLWGTGVAIVAVPDDYFAYRLMEAR